MSNLYRPPEEQITTDYSKLSVHELVERLITLKVQICTTYPGIPTPLERANMDEIWRQIDAKTGEKTK